MKANAVLMLSGGLDSTVALAQAKKQYEIKAITFDFGQRHTDFEIASARLVGRESWGFRTRSSTSPDSSGPSSASTTITPSLSDSSACVLNARTRSSDSPLRTQSQAVRKLSSPASTRATIGVRQWQGSTSTTTARRFRLSQVS